MLEIDKAHIVGHSMGGMIGQMIAIQRPELALSLVTINSAAGPGFGPAMPRLGTLAPFLPLLRSLFLYQTIVAVSLDVAASLDVAVSRTFLSDPGF